MYTLHPAILSVLYCRLGPCPLVAILFSTAMGTASAASLNMTVRADVFCVDECEVSSQRTIKINNTSIEIADLQVHTLGYIQHIEAELSENLSNQSGQSKRLALQHIQGMDAQTRTLIQKSANGLAKAMQFGIDRAPAIVFDGQVIIYGITDLRTAAAHYLAWRVENEL